MAKMMQMHKRVTGALSRGGSVKRARVRLEKAVGGSNLGTPTFVDEVMAIHLQGKEDANVPALRQLTRRPGVEEIIQAVKAAFPGDEKRVRNVSMHICHRHSGLALRQSGEQFQVRDTAITEASRRVMNVLEKDEQLFAAVEELRRRFEM